MNFGQNSFGQKILKPFFKEFRMFLWKFRKTKNYIFTVFLVYFIAKMPCLCRSCFIFGAVSQNFRKWLLLRWIKSCNTIRSRVEECTACRICSRNLRCSNVWFILELLNWIGILDFLRKGVPKALTSITDCFTIMINCMYDRQWENIGIPQVINDTSLRENFVHKAWVWIISSFEHFRQ